MHVKSFRPDLGKYQQETEKSQKTIFQTNNNELKSGASVLLDVSGNISDICIVKRSINLI